MEGCLYSGSGVPRNTPERVSRAEQAGRMLARLHLLQRLALLAVELRGWHCSDEPGRYERSK